MFFNTSSKKIFLHFSSLLRPLLKAFLCLRFKILMMRKITQTKSLGPSSSAKRSFFIHKTIVFAFSCIFILLSGASDQCAIQARLGVAGHLSTTPRWENPAKCVSQRHNKYTCRLYLHTVPLMLSAKQGSCEYQL